MHSLSKDTVTKDQHPAIVGVNWELYLPASVEDRARQEREDSRASLRRAELIMRAQEERIQLLERMVLTDELTGLANRRGFAAAFERELALARRDTAYCGILVMIDLDGFKSVNDKWGHQAGDAYLCAVAEALQENVRGTDIVARLGGDEFALLLTHMDEKVGAKRMTKLEQAFGKRAMILQERIPLCASFGFASYTGTDQADDVMQTADMRLYAHKARRQGLKIAGA